MENFCAEPTVQLKCMSFYLNKRLPTKTEFEKLLPQLLPLAIKHKLATKDNTNDELYELLINNSEIKKYIG